MKNLKVSLKIILSFTVVIFLSLGLTAVGLVGMYQIYDANVDNYDNITLTMVSIGDIWDNFHYQLMECNKLYVYRDEPSQIKDILKNIGDFKNIMLYYFIDYEAILHDKNLNDDSYYDFKKLYNDHYIPHLQQIIDNVDNLSTDMIKNFLTCEQNETMIELLDTSYVDYTGKAGTNMEQSNGIFDTVFWVTIIADIVIVLIGIAVSIYLPLSIGRPIGRMVKVADAIAEGNMELHVDRNDRKDELGKLLRALQSMKDSIRNQISIVESLAQADLTVYPELRSEEDTFSKSLQNLTENLTKIVIEVSSIANKVADESKRVAEESQELAQGTTEQASSIEELSSVVYEISLNTKENANLAVKASNLSNDVRTRAVHGEELMDKLIKSVKDTAAASKNIEKIIKVIEEIAFQTNILALNAAVEAAHAGQNGNGFAVVAAEVRNLASKSAESAKDTGVLISKALEQVEIGADIAQKTSESFNRIVDGIEESTRLISDIVKSSEEQAIAIEQINTGISQVAQVIHMNSGSAEKCANSAEQMNKLSINLEQTVMKFRIKGMSLNKPEIRNNQQKPQIKIDITPDIPKDNFGKY